MAEVKAYFDGNGQLRMCVSAEDYAALEAENARLSLLANKASTYWYDGDTEYDDPSEFARENRLAVDHVFPLQAAAYWPVEFRVTKADEENDDYEVVQVESTRRADFVEYFKIKQERDALKAPVSDEEMVSENWLPDDDAFKGAFNNIIAARAAQPKKQPTASKPSSAD